MLIYFVTNKIALLLILILFFIFLLNIFFIRLLMKILALLQVKLLKQLLTGNVDSLMMFMT